MLNPADSQNTTRDLAFSNLVNLSKQQGIDPDEYRARQLVIVKRTTPHMMLANILAAGLITWVAWSSPVFQVVVLWAVVMSCVSGLMLIRGWLKSRKHSDPAKVRKKVGPEGTRKAELHAAILGALWGALPAATFATAPAEVSFIIMGVVMGACGLGAFNLSRMPSAALIFASIVTSALAGAAFAVGGRSGFAAALLGTIYGFALGAMILKTHYVTLKRAGAQKALEQQNEIIKLLLRDFESGTKDWLWETDANGCLQYASERLGELIGRPLDDVLGKPLLDAVCNGQSAKGWAEIEARMANRQVIESVDVPLVNKGVISWWQINAEPIVDNQRKLEGYRGVAVDISETRRAADDMLAAKQAAERANAAKSQFLAVISHELRTPLNSILGYAELAASARLEPLEEEEQAEYLRNILEQSRHLNRLINDILDITRIERGNMKLVEQEVDVDELVGIIVKMCQLQARDAHVDLSENYETRGMVVRGDLTRLKQILVNLISNAIKFTPGSGQVEISVGKSAGGGPEFTVTDTGIGIQASKIRAIFEPFVQAEETRTRQYDGVGLGLSISRQLARLHDGDVTLVSEPGLGTVAKLTLPSKRLIGSTASDAAA
ncbi:MAG: HAMP domain-containing histidine kinase [Hyphomicrobiales bacterium]|nr:HAMP domain-containing histidine kinase [Hyphomicrobiales bacterium]